MIKNVISSSQIISALDQDGIFTLCVLAGATVLFVIGVLIGFFYYKHKHKPTTTTNENDAQNQNLLAINEADKQDEQSLNSSTNLADNAEQELHTATASLQDTELELKENDLQINEEQVKKELSADTDEIVESENSLESNLPFEPIPEKLIWKVDEISKLYVAQDDAIILKRSMKNKLKFASDDIKEFYNKIKNEIMSYKGVKTRMSNVSENFRKKRELIAKITLAGDNLKVFLALDLNDYPQNIYHQKDMSKMDLYLFVPFMLKIKTRLGVRKACFLVSEVMKKFGLVKNPKYTEQDFIADLIPDEKEALAKSRSVKVLREKELIHLPRLIAEKEQASGGDFYEEEPEEYDSDELDNPPMNLEAVKKAEEVLIWKVEDVAKLYVADDDAIILKRSMANKLKFADENIKKFYNSVKNTLMSYKGVKNRMSNVSENFRLKRVLLAKMTLAGANLKLFLALNINEYPANIYHQKDMGGMDLYNFVPFMVKIKTPLGARKACVLVDEVMRKFGLQKNLKYAEQDYIADLVPEDKEILAKSRSVITLREGELAGKMRVNKKGKNN
ncbi:MAG TPA: hypothetical protein VJZ69_00715 [Clostridia bacterium]|nr:hypothetical protein [Clostridia bacterium]